MISRLIIENYALIDKSEVEFRNGFTVITGETGAGKSIMLDALQLLMGSRADTKAMADKSRKTIIEGYFSNPEKKIKNIFDKEGIEWDEKNLLLRREILPSGKSRGFVNDTPVTLSLLSTISNGLIDIHSQHSNRSLSDNTQQLHLLDIFGGNQIELKEYQETFRNYVALRSKIKKAKEIRETLRENKEFIVFRLEQLEKLKPKSGELANLEKEYELLSSADRIKTELSEAYEAIDSDRFSVMKQLNIASSCLENIDLSLLQNENENLIDRISSLKIELKDIADTIRNYLEIVVSDPERLEKIRMRIDRLYEAMRRFKVKDEAELVELYTKLKADLKTINLGEEDIPGMEKELKVLAPLLKEKAEILTETRIKAGVKFSNLLMEKIRPLGLPNVNFEVEINKVKLSIEGQDQIIFKCSFNKNHKIEPIAEIASGGEISRVMLGIKAIMAEKMNLPTVIFDEIDSGVSGEIAHKMGKMMKDMSANMQVITVTHLPQVASAGINHFKVFKKDEGERTVSHIKPLNNEERVWEIAGMLSGTEINEAAFENARILLEKD